MLTKELFYKNKGQTYDLIDKEAIVRYEKILNWIDFNQKPTIIEIGCKFAELKTLIEKKKKKALYKAVDIDLSTIKRIEGYNEFDFKCANVNDGIPFENNIADYIVCSEIMEHLENPTFFLDECKRVLKIGGKIIISIPNPYYLVEMINNFFKREDTEGHISSFTYQNINALTRFSSIDILRLTGSFYRVPFIKRFFGKTWIIKNNLFFFSRNKIYLLRPKLNEA